MNSFAEEYAPGYRTELIEVTPNRLSDALQRRAVSQARGKEPRGVTFYVPLVEAPHALAVVAWHPARHKVLGILLKSLKANHANALFHLNNIFDVCSLPRAPTIAALAGSIEMENLFLDKRSCINPRGFLWHVHSDCIPPPDALETLLSRRVDIITAVVPKAQGTLSYINYYDENLPSWNKRLTLPHFYLYHLAKPTVAIMNPGRKILPHKKGVMEVAGLGFGCALFSRKAVEQAGLRRYMVDFVGKSWSDSWWSYRILKETRFKMRADTDVHCYHLCPPVALHKREGYQRLRANPSFKASWYGWNIDEIYGTRLLTPEGEPLP